jgi:hypothetical protein
MQDVHAISAARRNLLWALMIGDGDLAKSAKKRQKAPLIQAIKTDKTFLIGFAMRKVWPLKTGNC